jgi:hypothetical protein
MENGKLKMAEWTMPLANSLIFSSFMCVCEPSLPLVAGMEKKSDNRLAART